MKHLVFNTGIISDYLSEENGLRIDGVKKKN